MTTTPTDDDLLYLRMMLKPFDPADTPQTATRAIRPPALAAPRRRVGLLVAATAVVVALAAVIPTLVLDRGSSPATPQYNAAQALADCHQRSTAPARTATGDPDPALRSPALAWYTPAKAQQLTSTLRNALPAGTCIFPSSGEGDLRFHYGPDMMFATYGAKQVSSPTVAGRLVTAIGEGTLMVGVYTAPYGPGSCTLDLDSDKRFTTPDGTIIVTQSGAARDDATHWIVKVVEADRPDGSCVWLRVSDEIMRHDTNPDAEGMAATGAAPLTIDQLISLATTPGLDTSS